MKKFSTKILILSAIAILSIGCGSSGGDNDSNESVVSNNNNVVSYKKTGTVVDGYIKEATVCIDKNRNYTCDDNEPTYTTDNDGRYEFDVDDINYTHIVSGGTDITTNEPNNRTLLKPEGEENATITPITTLVAKYMINNNVNLSTAKSKIATVLGINIDDLTKDPMKDINITKIVAKLNVLLQKENIDNLINNIKTASKFDDLYQNYPELKNVFEKIDSLNITPEELEKNLTNIVTNNINFNENILINNTNVKEKNVIFNKSNETNLVDFNISKSQYILEAESATKTPYKIKFDLNNMKLDDKNVSQINDINITSQNLYSSTPEIDFNITTDGIKTLKVPFLVYDSQDKLVDNANIWIAVVRSDYSNEYNHSINLNQTITNKFLLKNERDQYYTFETNDSTAGNYEINITGIAPNPLGTFAVTLSDATGKKLIDDETTDNYSFNANVNLEANKTYTLTISITDGKLPSVRSDYLGYYKIQINKK